MANLRTTATIPSDLIATLTKLPRLQAQLRDMSQDVAIGIPEAVQEALDKAIDALALAELIQSKPFLLTAATADLPSARGYSVGPGLSINDGGPGLDLEVRLAAFLVALSQLSGNGLIAKTASGAELRAIESGSARIEVVNGDGTGGNPAIDIDEPSLDVGNMGGTLGVAHGGTGVNQFAAFSAHNNGVSQSIPSALLTQVSFSTEAYDVGGHFASSSWTPPAGRPVCMAGAVGMNLTSAGAVVVSIFKNGAQYKDGTRITLDAAGTAIAVVTAFDMPSGTDAYQLRVSHDAAGSQSTIGAAASTYFQGSML